MVFQVEKQLEEMGDQAPAELKSGIEEKINAVKDALKSDDLESIKAAQAELEKTLGDLAQAAQAAGGAAGAEMPDMADMAGGAPAGEEPAEDAEPRKAKGKVVDAEVVDSED